MESTINMRNIGIANKFSSDSWQLQCLQTSLRFPCAFIANFVVSLETPLYFTATASVLTVTMLLQTQCNHNIDAGVLDFF